MKLFVWISIVLVLGSTALYAQPEVTADGLLRQVNASPVTKALGISKIEKSDNGFSAKLDRIPEPVYLFLGDDGRTLNAAIALKGWSLAKVATVHAPVIIASTGDNAVTADALPVPLQPGTHDAVREGKLALKKGVNLFAGLDLSDKASLAARILSDVLGAPAHRVPLSGPMGTAVLDAIVHGETPGRSQLDGMQLDFTLPYLRPAGLDRFVSSQDVKLALVSKDGGVTLEGTFDLAADFGSRITLPSIRIREFRATAPPGQPLFSLEGDFPHVPDLIRKIPGLNTKKLGFGLDVTPAEKGGETVRVSVSGDATFRSQPVHISLAVDTAQRPIVPRVSVHSSLTLAQLVDHEIPVLGDIRLDELEFEDGLPGAKMTLDRKTVTVTGFHVGRHDAIALGLDSVSVATFVPELKNGPFDALRLEKPTIVFVPKGAGGSIHKGSLPSLLKEELGANLGDFLDGDSLNLREGLTFFGAVELTGLSRVRSALEFLGISVHALPLDLNLPLERLRAGAATSGSRSGAGGSAGSEGSNRRSGSAGRSGTGGTGGAGFSLRLTLPKLKAGSLPSFFKGDTPRIVTKPVNGAVHPVLEIPADFHVRLPGGPETRPVPFLLDFDIEALANRELVCTGRETSGKTWKNPFGIPFASIDGCTISLELSRKKQVLSLDGTFAEPHGKGCEIECSVDLVDGKLNDVTISLPKAKFKPESIPLLSNIPFLHKFSLSSPAFSLHGFAGKVHFRGIEVDLLVFRDGHDNWNGLVHMADKLTLGEFMQTGSMPELHKILDEIRLPDMCLILSEHGVEQEFSTLPRFVQERMPGKTASSFVLFEKGLSLSLTFEMKRMRKDVQDKLRQIGISSDLSVTGTVDGIFDGGSPYFALSAPMLSVPPRFCKALKWMDDASFSLTLELAGSSGFGVGFGTFIVVEAGKGPEPLVFDSKVMVQVGEMGVAVEVSGDMKGMWKDPLGIKGIELGNVTLGVGYMDDDNLKFRISGDFGWKMSDGREEKIGLAFSTSILVSEVPAPTSIGLAGGIDLIPFHGLYDLADAIVRKRHDRGMKGSSPRHSQLEIRNFAVAVMTPGARLPDEFAGRFDMGLAGVGIAGDIWLRDPKPGKSKFVAGINGHVTDLSTYVHGAVGDLAIGPVHLEGMDFLFQAGLNEMPEIAFKGKGKIGTGEHALSEDMKVVIMPTHFEFHMDTAIGKHEVSIEALSGGLSPDPKNDFTIDMVLKEDFAADLRKALADSLNVLKDADAAYQRALQLVQNRKKDVDDLQSQIDARKKSVQAEIDKHASDIKYNTKWAKHWQDKADAEWKLVVTDALHAVKHTENAKHYESKAKPYADKLVKLGAQVVLASPNDDKEIIRLSGKKKIADEALDAAKWGLSKLEKANSGLESASSDVLKATGNLKIREVHLRGSLRGLIPGAGGTTPTISVTVTWKNSSPITVHVSTNTKELNKALADALAAELRKIF